jgi:succinyl-CoA synthetase beta subunit
MAQKITEFTFIRHFAPRYKIPVPRHLSGNSTISEIRRSLDTWGGTALVKPDILAGKRGKAGAVAVVRNAQETVKELNRISGIEINGSLPRGAYLVEMIPAELEIFTAITYNSTNRGPALTISLNGGVNIEDISEDVSDTVKGEGAEIGNRKKITIPIDIFEGLDAYQASDALQQLNFPQNLISSFSRALTAFWDMFISTGMISAEINPWRITPDGKPFACDFKATLDEANYKCKIPGIVYPEYPSTISEFEESMGNWEKLSHQGQAHVSDLGGNKILPLLFGGGASTIITEILDIEGGSPIFLSDFGGNPPYERMYGTAKRCFDHYLAETKLVLILGGKANNTFIDITFQAIADALSDYCREHGAIHIPVIIGRGGPKLVKGFLIITQLMDQLQIPYVVFGPDSPVTMVAEYAAKLVNGIMQREAAGKTHEAELLRGLDDAG